jgi:hypothetical protein
MVELEDETNLTEITIQPDGRVFVFGASRPILDVLAGLSPDDSRIATLRAVVSGNKCAVVASLDCSFTPPA